MTTTSSETSSLAFYSNRILNVCRYSAIRCSAAIQKSTSELQRAQEKVVSAPTEASKPVVNNTAPASKPTSKQAKGIMGMFASKPAPKSEEQSKEVKMEQVDVPVSNRS